MAAKTAGESLEKSQTTSYSQDALSLQVSLPQMLDLALGTPEVGAVNLNILHNFLHVLLYRIDLRSTKVEYRGDDADRIGKMISSSSKDGPSLRLHEYNITDGSGRIMRRNGEAEMNADVYAQRPISGKSEKVGKPAVSAPATARGKPGRDGSESSVDSANDLPAAKKTKGSKQRIGPGIDGERQSVIFVEPVLDGVAPTALGFKRLDESVRSLENKFRALDELANNPEMIERVKGSKADPLSDMWHVINMSKRLDASEQGIDKLTTMVQDLIKSDKIEVTEGGNLSEQLGHVNERIVELENHLAYLSGDIADIKNVRDIEAIRSTSSVAGDHHTRSKSTVVVAEETQGSSVKRNISATTAPIASTSEQTDNDSALLQRNPSSTGKRRSVIGGVDLTELRHDLTTLTNEMNNVKEKVKDLTSKIIDAPDETSKAIGYDETPIATDNTPRAVSESPSGNGGPTAARSAGAVSDSGKKIAPSDATILTSKKTASKLSATTGSRVAVNYRAASPGRVSALLGEYDDEKMARCMEALNELDSRVSDLEKEMSCVTDRINSESGFGLEANEGIGNLVTKIQGIQADMDKINETALRLVDDKENRETHTSALIEQIELLKTIKADKEDLEDALADKADAQAVNRKVSHDQFDAACDDLARGLQDAIAKLGQQESIWQQALDQVQREIEGKLDKIEISPLKEFVDNKLELLQNKLKDLAAMRRDNEAAGTKKMLSDVKCISCDANVVMRMEEGAHYQAPTMPCTKSIKPYLTYELDQVRKQQRRLPHGRDMIQFEAAMREMARKAQPLKEDSLAKSPRDHLCNRYCGGSHTITTPQQRVMRMGHFLTQWGPEAIQLTEGVVRGNDGQLYRSRAMPGKPDVCGPCGDGESLEIPLSFSPLTSVPEPAPVSQRQSLVNQRRSSIGQASKRSSVRRVSEPTKELAEMGIEEIPVEPSTPPSAPPGTIIDEGDAIPEDQVVREATPEGDRTRDQFGDGEETNEHEE